MLEKYYEVNLGEGIKDEFIRIANKEFDKELTKEELEELSYKFCQSEELMNLIDDKVRELIKEI